MLVGGMGSGKSWTSKRIAEITGYPLYHLDVEFWKPDWVMTPHEEKVVRLNEIISGEKWIIDGNYGGTMELRYAAADLIIFLDISRMICMWSAAKRTGKKRSDLPDYLEEPTILKSREDFFDMIKMVWQMHDKSKKIAMDLHEKYPEKEFLRIKSRRQVKKLLKK